MKTTIVVTLFLIAAAFFIAAAILGDSPASSRLNSAGLAFGAAAGVGLQTL